MKVPPKTWLKIKAMQEMGRNPDASDKDIAAKCYLSEEKVKRLRALLRRVGFFNRD